MKNNKRRGVLATGWAFLTTMMLAVGGTAAQAALPLPQPVPDESLVTITKLAQPDVLGDRADGTALNTDTVDLYDKIGGVVFDYYLVEGTDADGDYDVRTNAGQEYAAGLTVESAPIDVDKKTGSFDATHGTQGTTTATLESGVYVIKEDPRSVPAGVTPAAPFLLTVPMTDPDTEDAWLGHIYVYPKNAQIGAEKTVENADKFVVGDEVTWTINVDIPRIPNPDYTAAPNPEFIAAEYFRIDDTLDTTKLEYDNAIVTVGDDALVVDVDYTLEQDTTTIEGMNTVKIKMLERGLVKMAEAVNADADAQVTVQLVTTVLKAAEIDNTAQVYLGDADSEWGKDPLNTPAADVKYGSVEVTKTSSVAESNLEGAEFELYLSKAAAISLDENGKVTPTDNNGIVQSSWTTDDNGKFTIEGLRYSNYADGEPLLAGDSRIQTYWLVEVKALDGHQLLPEPIEITVDGENDGLVLETVANQANTGGFELPLTGGQGTALLTVAGIAILGAVLFMGRRREDAPAA